MLQSASIHNPPCVRCKIASGVRTWNCAGPGAASNLSPEHPRWAFCAASRADYESADESRASR
eukprot:15462521-Alexandrium_andersonii.AAC.1